MKPSNLFRVFCVVMLLEVMVRDLWVTPVPIHLATLLVGAVAIFATCLDMLGKWPKVSGAIYVLAMVGAAVLIPTAGGLHVWTILGDVLVHRLDLVLRVEGHLMSRDELLVDLPGKVWLGTYPEDGDSIPIAVTLVDGQHMPMFYGLGRWRTPAVPFGTHIMTAWAKSLEALVVAWERVYRARDAYHKRSSTLQWTAYEAALCALADAGGPDLRAEEVEELA